MHSPHLAHLNAAVEALATAGFLLLWLLVWPFYRLYHAHRASH